VAQKGREKTFLICICFSGREMVVVLNLNQDSRFLSLAGLVVWFSHVIC
jgi:hypothetical protein